MRSLFSTTTFTILLCLAGAGAFGLPLLRFGYPFDLEAWFDAYDASTYWYGWEVWQSCVIAGVLFLTALFRIATGSIRPVRWWQMAGTGVAGITPLVLLALLAYDLQYGNVWHWHLGGFIQLGVGPLLLLLTSVDIRNAIARAQARAAQPTRTESPMPPPPPMAPLAERSSLDVAPTDDLLDLALERRGSHPDE